MEAVAPAINGEASPRAARVLMVVPSASGGLARHVISLLAGLYEEGYELGVACDAHGPVAEAARERSIRVYDAAIPARGSVAAAGKAALQVARASAELQAHIIHTHSFRAGLAGAAAMPLARRAQLVATIHNYPPGGVGMRPTNARERWAIRLLVRRASRLIAVSEALQCELTEVWPEAAEKTVSIPNGVDTSAGPVADPARCRATFELPLQGPLVGMMARLAPGKGIDEFIRAGRLLADRWPEVRLVVAGDGPLRGEAHALCAQLGMEGRLYLVGEIASPRELVGALDMLVVASTSEGSSVAAMEAMASGKPVVATAVGGVPEVVADGETGVLVRPGDPEALAAGIEALLRDPEKARRMGEHGRQRAAAKFDVRQMVARTKQVYADLLRHELEAGGTRR